MIRIDLHVHTACSRDSLTPPGDAITWARRRGLDAIAITDHNVITAGLALRDSESVQVIVGEEIRTTRGEIIGLFLDQAIAPGLTPEETIHRIRAQGGLVYIPHPLDRVRASRLDYGALLSVIDEVDIIEVLNARVTLAVDNRQAQELADAYHLLPGAGSDAHQGFEIGRTWVEMPPFADAPSFLAALASGRVRGVISSPLVHVGSTCARLAKGFLPLASSCE